MTFLAMLTCGFAVAFYSMMIRCGTIKTQILPSQGWSSFIYLVNLLAVRWFMTYLPSADTLFGIKFYFTRLVELVGAIPLWNSVFSEISLS